ncbi:MAG: DUF952 domain-containing protein [Methyloceanibacter sp.]
MDGTVYKVLSRDAFAKTKVNGRFEGSGEDARDGFIHLSSVEQLEDTLAKHYAGKDGLVLLAVDSESLGERLQWEPARGGALFPHLYGPLELSAVNSIEELTLGADGKHRLPDGISSLPGVDRWRSRG